jgi:hypothetical protein
MYRAADIGFLDFFAIPELFNPTYPQIRESINPTKVQSSSDRINRIDGMGLKNTMRKAGKQEEQEWA